MTECRSFSMTTASLNGSSNGLLTGEEGTYLQVQTMMSWYVHSGSAGTYGMNRVGLEMIFGISHIYAHRLFLKATEACGRATRISDLPEFAGWIREMSLKSGAIMIEAQLAELQKQRNANASEPEKPQ